MNKRTNDIWVLVQPREGILDDETFGLVAEARRLASELGGGGTVTGVALGYGLKAELEPLGACGTDKILYVEDESLSRYQGELFSRVLFKLIKKYEPSFILMVQGSETADLAPRLAACLETGLVTRAMDLKIDEEGKASAIRPVANGHLFEKLSIAGQGPPIICFLPAVLSAAEVGTRAKAEISTEPMDEPLNDLKTRVVKVIEAAPEDLGLEEADIVVAGGRGMGKGESFDTVHELAKVLGGSVGGTRPVIDWEILPYERQIGQTGKTISPRLLVNCGISGANEYTAGIEKSRRVIAINMDPRARIFQFADLGVIGDVQEILPVLIERIRETHET